MDFSGFNLEFDEAEQPNEPKQNKRNLKTKTDLKSLLYGDDVYRQIGELKRHSKVEKPKPK